MPPRSARKGLSLVFICFTVLALVTLPALASTDYNPEKTPLQLKVGGEKVDYRMAFRAVLPGHILEISLAPGKNTDYRVTESGRALPVKAGQVSWRAPQTPGYYPIRITRSGDGESVQLAVFVMQPASEVKNGRLNGYRINAYPPPLRGLASYRAPEGFIEVTEELVNVRVSPHFTLGQFLCKQAGVFPKYVVLKHRLLEKLELLLEDINAHGIRANSLVVMSGYRTPYYNRAIGNVAHSRHIYGGAADVFVDVNPVNNYMDDINRDGKTDINDAVYLYKLADSLVKRNGRRELEGGVGQYDKNAYHGPFVHVDVRGSRARWGH